MEQKQLNILVWAPFGAGTHFWGPGTSAYRLFKNNKDKNIKLTLVHGSDQQNSFPDVYAEQVKISTLDKKRRLTGFLFLIKSYLWLRKNHHKYDTFYGITAFYFTFFPAWYFNKKKGNTFIKITGGYGGFGENHIISKILGIAAFRKKVSNKLSGYIAISSFIKKNLKEYGIAEEKIFTIPNGVDINRFTPLTLKLKHNKRLKLNIPNKFSFIYVGGLTHNKRILNMVGAVNLLKNQGYNNFQLLIVGPDRSDGVIENLLSDSIKKHGLDEYILRVPFTTKPEDYYQASDVYLLISKMEGMANSLLEAMSCGLPAIVTKISGSEDLVNQYDNGLFSNGEPDNVANCMQSFLDNNLDIENMSLRARKKIIESFSNSAVLKENLRLFKHEKTKVIDCNLF